MELIFILIGFVLGCAFSRWYWHKEIIYSTYNRSYKGLGGNMVKKIWKDFNDDWEI
jgi:hypothetical protein